MSKLSLEFDLISRLLSHPEEVADLLALGIEPGVFRDPLAREVLEFSLTHHMGYGSLPDPVTVEAKFGFKSVAAPEPLDFYCRELITRTAALLMAEALPEVQTQLKAQNIDAAQSTLEETLAKVRQERNREIIISDASDTARRVKLYEAVESGSVPPGIPMPWADFTEATLGWKGGDFGVVVARTGVGKSWFTLMNAHSAWADGKKVLVVSMEMRPDDMHMRHDAYVSQVPFEALQRGTLTAPQKKRYVETMDEISSYSGFSIVGYNMAASVGQIQAVVERVEPDIVFVDGAYLCRPSGFHHKMSRNDKLEAVASELTMLAGNYQIPVIGSVQFNREQKKKAVDADLGNIYGSDTWAQNADFVFAMMQTMEDAADGVMRVSLIKGRNCPPFAARLEWDLSEMAFDLLEFEKGTTAIKPVKVAAPPPVAWAK